MYEADPRHVDLLAGALGLTAANSVTTPGVKDPEPDYQAEKHDEAGHESAVMGLVGRSERGSNREHDVPMPCRTDEYKAALAPETTTRSRKHVSFSDELEQFYVPAYSTIYGCHPIFISVTCDGWKTVSSHADPYTWKSGLVMRSRCAKVHDPQRRSDATGYRRRFLRQMVTALINALADTDAIYANRTPPATKT